MANPLIEVKVPKAQRQPITEDERQRLLSNIYKPEPPPAKPNAEVKYGGFHINSKGQAIPNSCPRCGAVQFEELCQCEPPLANPRTCGECAEWPNRIDRDKDGGANCLQALAWRIHKDEVALKCFRTKEGVMSICSKCEWNNESDCPAPYRRPIQEDETCRNFEDGSEVTRQQARDLFARPDALEAVKGWLAGKGYGVFFADSFEGKTCYDTCLAAKFPSGCKQSLCDPEDNATPGPKCPAMLARKGKA